MWISDIPLSFNNADIEATLKKHRCTLMSEIKYECERDTGRDGHGACVLNNKLCVIGK